MAKAMLHRLAATILACAATANTEGQVQQVSIQSPLKRNPLSAPPVALANGVSTLSIDESLWGQTRTAQAVRLVDVPLGPSRNATLLLHRVTPFSQDAVIVEVAPGPRGTLIERPLPHPDADFWVGSVEGDSSARVLLSRSAAGMFGYVQLTTGTAILSSGPPHARQPLVSFWTSDLPDGAIPWLNWSCQLDGAEPQALIQSEGGTAEETPCRQLSIAVDSDYEFSAFFGGNTAMASAYAGLLFTGALDAYSRDLGLRPQVTYLRLWPTSNDPWSATNLYTVIDEFRNYWLAHMTSVERVTAHMLAGRQIGGGIATPSSLCGTNAYAVSGHLTGFFPYPLVDGHPQNWDIWVVCHELGHNVGAPHTHSYCPPVDECAPEFFFGPCQTQQVCQSTGTFMSYCHACAGGFVNQQLRFHPASMDSIQTYLGTACDLTGPALPPVGVTDAMSAVRGVTTSLDVLANEVGLNCEQISIGAAPSTSTNGGSVTILPGGGPEGRDVLRYLAPAGTNSTDMLWYRIVDSSQQSSQDIAVVVTVLPHPCDLDSNGIVDGADLGLLLGAFGSAGPLGDVNQDQTVDGADLGMLLGAWTI